ncbi:hypothetical protein [Microbispora hainanensis]|uniref:Uncharacterized protein n=1 Tax=Microbispora hainanensis TaxID=568844 RepID=A0A544YMH4_9ACTN|nr:hypothetical protein [Microbispora hainanensis]TQS17940.1 hypothetical protein FLX08_26645 [Microbispora hainanensis]
MELTEEQHRLWRRWVLTVFLPSARQMRDAIVDHGDLFIEDQIPHVVLDFCAHIASYEVTAAEWAAGEEGKILVNHPGEEFVAYVRESYKSLKDAQAEVLLSTASIQKTNTQLATAAGDSGLDTPPPTRASP